MASFRGRHAVIDWNLTAANSDEFREAFVGDLTKAAKRKILPGIKKDVPKLSGRSRKALYVRHARRPDSLEFGYRRGAHYFGATKHKVPARDRMIQELPGLFPAALRSAQRVLPKEGNNSATVPKT